METNRPRRYSICSLPSITNSTADSGCSSSEPQNLLKTALISSYQVNSLSYTFSVEILWNVLLMNHSDFT